MSTRVLMGGFLALACLATSVGVSRADQFTFTDDFEGSTLDPFWTPFLTSAGSITFPSTDQAHNGAQSIQFNTTNISGIDKYATLTHSFATPLYGRVSVWMYDTAVDVASSNYIFLQLSNRSIAGNYASLKTMDYDRGSYENYYYYELAGTLVQTSVPRTTGWHQFSIDYADTGLTMSVDGVVVYTGPSMGPFNEIWLGEAAPYWRPPLVTYFDDFSIDGYSVPEFTFTDDFESSTLDPFWTPFLTSAGSITFPSTAQAHNGAQSIQFNTMDVGGIDKYATLTHSFAKPLYGHVSVWMYDTAVDVASSNYIFLQLSNRSIAGNYASLKTVDYDRGSFENYYYYELAGALVQTSVPRTTGWHQFSIDYADTGLTMSVDGIVVYTGPSMEPFNEIWLGEAAPYWRPPLVTFFDDFSFYGYSVPELPVFAFYNNSAWDGGGGAANTADDNAIAPDKLALRPGQTATLTNYTNYSRGINGVTIDMQGLPGTPTLNDLLFRKGNDNQPYGDDLDNPDDDWPWAPDPVAITVRPGEGQDGRDRVTLIWEDGAIRNCWLQVTVLATDTTGLAANEVFYIGNAVGESGNSTADALVNATDEIGARNHPHSPLNPAAIDDLYDFNHDKLVNATDQIIARNNRTSPLTALKLITPPLEPSGSGN